MAETPYIYSKDDLDPDLVLEIKERTGHEDMTPEEFLMHYGFIDSPGNEGACCIEAMLLFASKYRSRFHSRAGIRVYTVNGTDVPDMSDNGEYDLKRFSGPLLEMIDTVFTYMPGVIKKSARLYSLFLREMPQYPEEAWHEFIVNAVVHRDYAVREREIEIWVFDDRIEIESPGRLYSGISAESLAGPSRVQASRNPKLADIFMRAGYMREVGEGIRGACRVMERSYLNPPRFTETETGFRVTLQNSPVFDVGDADWEEKIRKLDLNLNQKRILIVYGKTGFANSDYQKINSCDRDTAYREILEIADKGYVVKEGKGRGLQYIPDID